MQDVNLHHRVINYHRLENKKGIYVMSVEKNSPAETVGLKEGDVIVNFNGHVVNTGDKLFSLLNKDRIGIVSPLIIVRHQSQLMTIDVSMQEKTA